MKHRSASKSHIIIVRELALLCQRLFTSSSTFFGREIGLMYMHAHLRYAQAMARYGAVEAFFLALCQAHPIAIRSVVPMAVLRQVNCYYSSLVLTSW